MRFLTGMMCGILGFASLGMAAEITARIDVDGKVLVRNHDGDLVGSAITLSLPEKGKGDIILKGDHYTLVSKKFNVRKYHGRTEFNVAFPLPMNGIAAFTDKLDSSGKEKAMLYMTGSYMRDDKSAVYFGDLYVVTKSHGGGHDHDADKAVDDPHVDSALLKNPAGVHHIGGFMVGDGGH